MTTWEIKNMRYFLLFWKAQVKPESYMNTYVHAERSYMSQVFLSRDEVIADLERTHPELEHFHITNLIELTKEDYERWISKDRQHLEARYESEVKIFKN